MKDLADQCRMQMRDQLDPEFSQFMSEIARRLSAFDQENGRLSRTVSTMVRWLEHNQPDAFMRGIWDAPSSPQAGEKS